MLFLSDETFFEQNGIIIIRIRVNRALEADKIKVLTTFVTSQFLAKYIKSLPKKVLSFDKESNNSLLFYCLFCLNSKYLSIELD